MTIRNSDEAIKTRLRIRAAMHGRSMEDEARDILRAASQQRKCSGRGILDKRLTNASLRLEAWNLLMCRASQSVVQ